MGMVVWCCQITRSKRRERTISAPLIFTSTAYQFSSIQKAKTPEAKANFASCPLRRVEAEVLIDALNAITGNSDLYTSAVPEPFTRVPARLEVEG